MKKRILSMLLVLTAVLTIALPAAQANADVSFRNDGTEYSINAKKDIPDIFALY